MAKIDISKINKNSQFKKTFFNNGMCDMESSRDKLVDFALDLVSGKADITDPNTLLNSCESFFDYTMSKYNQDSIFIPSVSYTIDNTSSISLKASAGYDNITLYTKNLSKYSFTAISELFTSVFHETQHISDDYNDSIKNQTLENTNTQKSFTSDHMFFLQDYLNDFTRRHFTKLSNQQLKQETDDMNDYFYKFYHHCEGEVRARTTEVNWSRELFEYALTREDIKNDETKTNQINGILQEVEKLARQYTKRDNLYSSSTLTDYQAQDFENYCNKMMNNANFYMNVARQSQLMSKLDERNGYVQDEFATDSQVLTESLDDLILSEHFNLTPFNFDYEDRAYDIAEIILTALEDELTTKIDLFSTLVNTTGYTPTIEQMERIANVYQDYNPDEDYAITYGLPSFLNDFALYSQKVTLPIYAQNNPDFEQNIELFENLFCELDEDVASQILESRGSCSPKNLESGVYDIDTPNI